MELTPVNEPRRTGIVVLVTVITFIVILVGWNTATSQLQNPSVQTSPPSTLGLDQGYIELNTPDFKLKLVKASQTVAALMPKAATNFDFTPGDLIERRAANGYHHLGDLTFIVRKAGSGTWLEYDTAHSRKPVAPLPPDGKTLAAADLSATLPADTPVHVVRSWALEDGRLVLRFELKNQTSEPLVIGGLGIPLIFNNILTGRSLKEAHETCSFFDPYIGQDAGYLQVTRLNGGGPTLVVVPEGQTPFEAYQPLDEPVRASQTFEGAFSWLVHSQAYADNKWRKVEPWNPPTSITLPAGATRTYGLRFLVSDQIRDIEQTLAVNKRPVAVGIPGYVLPVDLDARLFLKYPHQVIDVGVEPRDSIVVQRNNPTADGWKSYTLRGTNWGRARLTVTYDDNSKQSISYYVIKSARHAVDDLGTFLLTRQWFDDPNDPFHRSPSVIGYDRETNEQVTQDSRVWIAGLGDEGGSGSWLAAAMKEFGRPNQKEIRKYEEFIDKVLWGGIQYRDGPNKYGVRKSMFYYSPQDLPDFQYEGSLDWTTWTSWKRADAEGIGRGYNYPHVVAAYWSLYRLARNYTNLVSNHRWDWYLNQAYETTRFAFSRNPDGSRRVGYVELGLMEGDIFLALLKDLKLEGWLEKAADIEKLMKERARRWRQESFPFGSEMAWDSTGQEEVYAWCDYFGYHDQALVSLNSILGYMPTIPHWGYNGNARRYWDFLYAGKLRRIERQLHHYGSGLNAIPVLSAFREHPEDYYLLRVGYGGTMGALTNIDQEGFASVAFHSFPDTLKWDGYSGDYGPNFFGHGFNTATYVIDHPEFGWQAFGANVRREGDWLYIEPRDSFRMRVYVAPRGLWLTLDAGTLEHILVNTRTNAIRVGLSARTESTSVARLRLEQPARLARVGDYHPRRQLRRERDCYVIPLQNRIIWIDVTDAVR
jgi:Family of unknown function (DUF5695)